MPHIVVEYSDNITGLNVPKLVQELHATLAKEESVDIKRIKSRAIPFGVYVVGDKGPDGAMVHITLKVLPRPVDVAKRMALDLQKTVRNHVKPECAVTVEIVNLDGATYCA